MKQSLISRTLILIGIAAGAFVMLIPFLYMVTTALTEYAYALPYPPRLLPDHPTLENFVRAWTSNNFGLYTFNSIIVAISTVAGVVFVGSLSGYGFARFHFPGKEIVFRVLIFSMMIPSIIFLIPSFLVLRDLHLLNSRLGLVVIYTAGGVAFNTFLLRSFFEGLPRELEEAVLIDGGGRWTIYWNVVLPLSQPALATVSIMSFLSAWDDFFWPMILIKDNTKWTLQIAIRLFQGMHATNYALVFAASLIAMVPAVVLFIFGQKYFIQGLSSGGVKG